MRALAGLILIVSSVLGTARPLHADDAPLPPPTVIKRSSSSSAPPPQPIAPQPTAPRPLAPQPAPPVHDRPAGDDPGSSRREIQQRIDAYLADDQPLFAPTGMPGLVGYDQGFRFRTGGFRLAINLLLQARYEAFLFDGQAPAPGGDLSGFSLPRAVLSLSGTAECAMRYRIDLDFGHHGGPEAFAQLPGQPFPGPNLGPRAQTASFDVLREAWVQWSPVNVINVRAGLLRTPNTRQLLVRPEHTQFVDVALGSAWTGSSMPGYTDRNRDYGLMVHGTYGPVEQFSYMLAVTNGDGGDDVRGVLDQRASDNPAISARANYAFFDAIGYQEGALRQCVGKPYGEVGLWAYYYDDRLDGPHTNEGDYLRYGIDLALGYGPLSLTAAYTLLHDDSVPTGGVGDSTAWLAQLGYHVTGTAFELATRWSGYDADGGPGGGGVAQEFGLGLNYYLNGHGNKLQLDASYITTDAGAPVILDPYAGYSGRIVPGEDAWLLRLQWQLGL